MTTLQRLRFYDDVRKRSLGMMLSPDDALARTELLRQRRARVRELLEEGRVVDGGTSQFSSIQKRNRVTTVREEE